MRSNQLPAPALENSIESIMSEYLASKTGSFDSHTASGALTPSVPITIGEVDKAARQILDERLRHGPPLALEAPPPWLVIVSVPLGTLITTFLAKASEDAYIALKRVVKRMYEKSKSAVEEECNRLEIQYEGTDVDLRLRDSDSNLIVELDSTLRDPAYRALFSLELPKLPEGYIPKRLSWFSGRGWVLTIDVPIKIGQSQTFAQEVYLRYNRKRRWVPLNWLE